MAPAKILPPPLRLSSSYPPCTPVPAPRCRPTRPAPPLCGPHPQPEKTPAEPQASYQAAPAGYWSGRLQLSRPLYAAYAMRGANTPFMANSRIREEPPVPYVRGSHAEAFGSTTAGFYGQLLPDHGATISFDSEATPPIAPDKATPEALLGPASQRTLMHDCLAAIATTVPASQPHEGRQIAGLRRLLARELELFARVDVHDVFRADQLYRRCVDCIAALIAATKPYGHDTTEDAIKRAILGPHDVANPAPPGRASRAFLAQHGMDAILLAVEAAIRSAPHQVLLHIDSRCYYEILDIKRQLSTDCRAKLRQPGSLAGGETVVLVLGCKTEGYRPEILAELEETAHARCQAAAHPQSRRGERLVVVYDATITPPGCTPADFLASPAIGRAIEQGVLELIFAKSFQKFATLGTGKVMSAGIAAVGRPDSLLLAECASNDADDLLRTALIGPLPQPIEAAAHAREKPRRGRLPTRTEQAVFDAGLFAGIDAQVTTHLLLHGSHLEAPIIQAQEHNARFLEQLFHPVAHVPPCTRHGPFLCVPAAWNVEPHIRLAKVARGIFTQSFGFLTPGVTLIQTSPGAAPFVRISPGVVPQHVLLELFFAASAPHLEPAELLHQAAQRLEPAERLAATAAVYRDMLTEETPLAPLERQTIATFLHTHRRSLTQLTRLWTGKLHLLDEPARQLVAKQTKARLRHLFY